MYRFVKKVWHLFQRMENEEGRRENDKERLRFMHQTIKGVTEDLEHLRFNTAIAKLMTWYNFLAKQPSLSHEEMEIYLKLFAPFAPHMTEELYQEFENGEGRMKDEERGFQSIHTSEWPSYDEKYLVQETVTVAVQINGKLRGTVEV
ncbi:MAG: class I tRNA ligase family protein, partial [Candidatus Levyibacteriota bacterium]